MLERLVLRPELCAFEKALNERLTLVAGLDDERFAKPRTIEHVVNGSLIVISEFVGGRRLSDIIDEAHEHGIVAGLDAGLGLLLELLPAVARLHDAGLAHGAIAPGRIMITPAGQILLLDAIYAEPLERLQLTRTRLWSELRLAFPMNASAVRFDKSADLSHSVVLTASLIVGRPLRDDEYPDGISSLRQEILEIASIRGTKSFAESVDRFFATLLPAAGKKPAISADEAAIDLRKLVRKELGINTCRTALTEFFQQVEAADAERLATETAQRDARIQQEVERLAEAQAAAERQARERDEAERVAREKAKEEAQRQGRERLVAERRAREQAEAERKAREEAERKAREEAERRVREKAEAERKAREEAERKAREEAERKARSEAERKAREEAERKAREEAERKARAEAERKAREEAERKARAEAERKAREEAERKAREEAERKARAEAERKAREEADRKARAEADRKAREEADRKARIEAELRARVEAEFKAREEAERKERERLDAERKAREKVEAEKRARERREAERIAREKAETEKRERERVERERLAREARERAEKARLEAERLERERLEAERVERERAAQAARERAEREHQEAERLEREARDREAEEAREHAERERLESDRLKRERLAREEAERNERLEKERRAAEVAAAAQASGNWLVNPKHAASFEPTVPDGPARPAPPAAAKPFPTPPATPGGSKPYPIYVPPSEPAAWTADTAPPQPPIEITPFAAPSGPAAGHAAAQPSPPLKLKDSGPIKFKDAGPIKLKDAGPIRLKDAAPIRLQDMAPAPVETPTRGYLRHEQEGMSAAGGYAPSFGMRDEPERKVPWKFIAAAVVLLALGLAAMRGFGPSAAPAKAPPTQSAPDDATKAPTPAVASGEIDVKTDPPGLTVLLDGKPAGQSPVTLKNVPVGRHIITMAGDGGTVKRTVKVAAGAGVSVDASVYSGFLKITAPFVIEIAENGKTVGTSEEAVILGAGHHKLYFSNEDLAYSATQDVDVQSGETSHLTVNPRGSVNINAAPWAEVWIDGERQGETPLANVAVRLGVREFIFKNPQFPDRKIVQTVKAGTTDTISVDFNKDK
jgi:hypothetical protein